MRRHKDETVKPRVAIVGAGFGGIAAAKALARAPVEVTVIDRRNFHLFQPLLYQVATAALSPSDIAMPIRTLLKRQRNASVLLGQVTGIDATAREVLIGEKRVPYDLLVLATGARHAYFGHDEWEPYAPGLKKIDDAIAIRRRILEAFERAEAETDLGTRARLLTFVVVGGGPTGVEMAGAIAELAKKVLVREFRHIDPGAARILLVEAGSRVLSPFPERLSDTARKSLERLGVEVLVGNPVSECDRDGVVVAGRRIEADTVIWAAGVIASPAAKWLGARRDKVGRVIVRPDLSVPGYPEVFVIGDTALASGRDGKPLPGVAAVAKQQGNYVGRLIRDRLHGAKDLPPFRYRHFGSLATIGRKAAIAHIGRLRLSGWIAWMLWGLVHVYFLVGLRNRIVVTITWLWAYLTYQFGSRLIIGDRTWDNASAPQTPRAAQTFPEAEHSSAQSTQVLQSVNLENASSVPSQVGR